MILQLHDSETDSLAATIPHVDYDHQAEQWIIDTHKDWKACVSDPGRWVVRWILLDDEGERAVWERKPNDSGMPALVKAADRFTGSREMGNREMGSREMGSN